MYEQALGCYVSVGFNTFFAHVTSRHEFLFREGDLHLNEGDRNYLFAVKEQMHNELGVTPPLYSHTGLGDIDLYLRFGNRWEYTCKFRRIDIALRQDSSFLPHQKRRLIILRQFPLVAKSIGVLTLDLKANLSLKRILLVACSCVRVSDLDEQVYGACRLAMSHHTMAQLLVLWKLILAGPLFLIPIFHLKVCVKGLALRRSIR